MNTEARAAAGREGGHRGGAEMREQRLDGLAFAQAWKARGGAQERWRDYVRSYGCAKVAA